MGEIIKLKRREIKIEEEVGKDQNCGEGNSRMRGENNKIVREGTKKGKKEEEGKILKLWRRE